MGGTIDFTEEELVFSALHHDFGKLGDLDHEYYIPNDDDWRRKKLGEIFTNDPNINNMRVPDRALWLLQHFGIKCSIKETMPPSKKNLLSLPSLSSWICIFNPLLRKASSLNRLDNISNLKFKSSKISESALNLIRVPVEAVSPITSRGETGFPFK